MLCHFLSKAPLNSLNLFLVHFVFNDEGEPGAREELESHCRPTLSWFSKDLYSILDNWGHWLPGHSQWWQIHCLPSIWLCSDCRKALSYIWLKSFSFSVHSNILCLWSLASWQFSPYFVSIPTNVLNDDLSSYFFKDYSNKGKFEKK